MRLPCDAGAPMNAPRNEVIRIIGNRNILYNESKPILVLSHWDKDHYHSLIGMTDVELQNNFSAFVCRDHIPNLTSRSLFNRLKAAVGTLNTFAIKADIRYARGGPTFFNSITPANNQIILYNAQHHKNRNISGLILTVKSANKSVVLSGDAHYEQISRDILPQLNYSHKHNLVVPHHGGKAGTYIYNIPPLMTVEDAIISVGINHYGHPLSCYTTALRAGSFCIRQTISVQNDIIINL
ncbi:hypothetical protein AGMMS4957_16410 [Bacteroidia bacterium]|nr:hypothetical protein AGMMS4957_16410 [Bacteroidia bacterium]